MSSGGRPPTNSYSGTFSHHREFPRVLAAILIFGSAFGLIEAAVVIDLRAVYEPLLRKIHPSAEPGDLFPLLTPVDLEKGPPGTSRLLAIEVAREAATILLLAGFGIAIGGRPLRMFSAFVAAFGVWDIVFYVALRLLIGWPASVWTWDLLFLIPVPWTGPVIAPVAIAATMVLCGLHAIARDLAGRPIKPTWQSWLGVLGGGLLVLLAFFANARLALAHGVPETFPWPLFGLGAASNGPVGLPFVPLLLTNPAGRSASTE